MTFTFKRDSDGLIADHWSAISTMIAVAAHADAEIYAVAFRKLAGSRYGRRGHMNALYVYGELLIGYVLELEYGLDLNRLDLARLAQKLEPRVLALLPKLALSDRAFERILLSAYVLDEEGERVEDLKMVPALLATLGVLTEETGVTLDQVRPRLAEWCDRNRSEFHNIQI